MDIEGIAPPEDQAKISWGLFSQAWAQKEEGRDGWPKEIRFSRSGQEYSIIPSCRPAVNVIVICPSLPVRTSAPTGQCSPSEAVRKC